jgi:hypothetical protein
MPSLLLLLLLCLMLNNIQYFQLIHNYFGWSTRVSYIEFQAEIIGTKK